MDSEQSLDRGNCWKKILNYAILSVFVLCVSGPERLSAKSNTPEEYVGPSPGMVLHYESGDGIEVVVEVQKGTNSRELVLEETLLSPDWAIKAGAPAIIKTVHTRTYDDCRIYQSNRWGEGVAVDFCRGEWELSGSTPEQGRVMWPCSMTRRGVESLFGEERRTLTVTCAVEQGISMDFVWAQGIGLLRYNGLELVKMEAGSQ